MEDPVVVPGGRTAARVHVLDSGTAIAYNVTVVLTDGSEKGPDGVVMRGLGEMAPAGIKATTLVLTYAIADSVRLGALNVAVFSRLKPIDIAFDFIRRSKAAPSLPTPIASRSVAE